MSKYFLYIDESKDFKHDILYIWGFASLIGLQKMEKICNSLVLPTSKKELKSTQDYDRRFFECLNLKKMMSYFEWSKKIFAWSDKDYLFALLEYIDSFLKNHPERITELQIYADYTRLAPDMKTVEKIFSRKLSHTFGIPIKMEFKNSQNYRVIQFADLIVWIYRRSFKA